MQFDFVDDGSRDKTWKMIQEASASNAHVKGVHFSRNFGKESAIIAGLAEASGDCCAVIDVYFANSCYLKAEIRQKQTLNEMAVLVTRIKSVEHYKDEMPVAIVITGDTDSTRTEMHVFDDITIIPYGNWLTNPFNNKRNMLNSLSIWCGFSPEYVDPGRFAEMREVQEMPCYPDDGSIRIIDDTVVVKM